MLDIDDLLDRELVCGAPLLGVYLADATSKRDTQK
jgi:hypothetical protein